ncbi:hypothetical protein [Novosphingobium sp. AP12]|uniref:hypothetical protein n=1 Tax=Novosphingobium sp. AP12 TaxID=1144305 RepID=UPI000271E1EE|nr:hypothetical protein [Novosphingobium sp. AP12]EJL34679.1 hypothetical protein PMI02_00584 [Novosphingobium sp. AP12]
MADETVVTPPSDAPATHTTIIHESPRSSSGMGIIMALILLVVVVGGIYLFTQNSSESRKDNAIAEAAGDVGNAATKVGDAAENAVNTSK